MGPPTYMLSQGVRNVFMRRMTVILQLTSCYMFRPSLLHYQGAHNLQSSCVKFPAFRITVGNSSVCNMSVCNRPSCLLKTLIGATCFSVFHVLR